MEHAAKVDLLNRVLHQTVNSALQYVETSTPYIPEGMEEAMESIRALRDEQTATANELTERIAALDGVPKVGAFPYWNVDLNYLDVRFMARFAGQHEERAAAELEKRLDAARGDAVLHGLLTRVLEQKKAHATKLAGIAATEIKGPTEEEIAAAQPADPQNAPRPKR